jgi:hypothetical protein
MTTRALPGLLLLGLSLATATAAAETDKKPPAEEVARWKTQVAKWLKQLPEDYRYPAPDQPAAAEALRAVDDAAIVPALAARMETERSPHVRLLLVEVAAKFKTEAALEMLVKAAITDAEKDVRRAAVKTWIEFHRDEDILARLPPYIESDKLRYAALDALERSGILAQVSPGQTPDKVLVKTLIKHLYRKDTQIVPVTYHEHGTFDGGRGRYIRNKQGLARLENIVPDVVVLESLKRITLSDHGYDRERWSQWILQRTQ